MKRLTTITQRVFLGVLSAVLCLAATGTARADNPFGIPTTPSLVGQWKCPGNGNNGVKELNLQFGADGSVSLVMYDANGKVTNRIDGRYTLSGGSLAVTRPDGTADFSGTLVFQGNDSFVLTLNGNQLLWTRVVDSVPQLPPAIPAPQLPGGIFDTPAAPSYSVVGTWAYKAADYEGKEVLGLKLNADGTFVCVKVDPNGQVTKRVEGTYTYSNGAMTMTSDGKVWDEATLTWNGGNKFVLKHSNGNEMAFDRM